MLPITRIALAAAGCAACVAGSAGAAELAGAELNELIAGKSTYLELTTASSTGTPGQGVIYYAADGKAHYKTAKGAIWRGTWVIKDNAVCLDWPEAPNNPCTKYDRQGDVLTLINVATGQTRGKLIKSVTGDTEKLSP
jgi:hypothetical protein